MSFQSTPPSCCTIIIPTTTNAGAVTALTAVLKTTGEIKIDRRNNTPAVTAVNPVLPPTPTPLELSTKEVTVEVPKTAPATVPIESATNACSAFSSSPFR